MNKIKVIEGLKPWEIMKAYEEGKRIAYKDKMYAAVQEWEEVGEPAWNLAEEVYAVIDDTQPVIPWDEFDWEFFKQYDGLPVIYDYTNGPEPAKILGVFDDSVLGLHESPFYPWFGSKQPVPDCVEVEIEAVFEDAALNINREWQVLAARDVRWNNDRLIAFRLTGNVL